MIAKLRTMLNRNVICKWFNLILTEEAEKINIHQTPSWLLEQLKLNWPLNNLKLYITCNNVLFNSIPANLRSVVYCTALGHGDAAEWNFLWERYRESIITTEQVTILSALGCTKNVSLLAK
jgi:hypothetical protein